MTVYLEDFDEIVDRLESDRNKSEKYLDELRLLDSSLAEFVSENQYNNTQYFQTDFLLRKFLGEELYDWVIWYLYEMPLISETDYNCSVNGVRYLVTDFNSFMDFARHGLCLPMKPNLSANENEEDTE